MSDIEPIGGLALGEIGIDEGFFGGSWSVPVKNRVAVAVLACAFSSFVAPPQVQTSPQFTSFSQPVRAQTPQQAAWLNTPFTPPSAAFSGFAEFSTPSAGKSAAITAQRSWSFAPTQPASVPFFGFFEFGRPQQTRFNIALETTSVMFEVELPVIPQTGGTSRKLPLPEVRTKKHRTGFEPIKKVRAPPEVIRPEPIPLPPFKLPRAPESLPAPPVIVDPNLIPKGLLGLQDQIYTAQDVSDIEAFLRGQDQDEQDIADILDVLKLIEGDDEQS